MCLPELTVAGNIPLLGALQLYIFLFLHPCSSLVQHRSTVTTTTPRASLQPRDARVPSLARSRHPSHPPWPTARSQPPTSPSSYDPDLEAAFKNPPLLLPPVGCSAKPVLTPAVLRPSDLIRPPAASSHGLVTRRPRTRDGRPAVLKHVARLDHRNVGAPGSL